MIDDTNNDDVLTIEDTGESLEDFELHEELPPAVKKTESVDAQEDMTENEEVEVVLEDIETPERESSREKELHDQLVTMKDNYLRTLAELENMKKRTRKEKDEHYRFALTGFFNEFLPIVDNFHRAVEVESNDMESYHQGVCLILRQVEQLLDSFGIKEIQVKTGDKFDPMYQEAVATEEVTDVDHPSVGEIMQKGYLLNNRLLRPVLVKVHMPVHEEKEVESDGESTGD